MVTQAITPAFGVKRTFYIGLSLFCALIVFTGFWPSYFGLTFTGTFEHPAVIHFHAAVYVGWLMLFIAQTWFAATGRLALHMTLGRFAIGYGVLVIVVGLTVTFGIFAIRVRADQIAQTQTAFLGVPNELQSAVAYSNT